MILHTVLPFAEIFPEERRKNRQTQTIDSGVIECEGDKILDIFSTDPRDYLKYGARESFTAVKSKK